MKLNFYRQVRIEKESLYYKYFERNPSFDSIIHILLHNGLHNEKSRNAIVDYIILIFRNFIIASKHKEDIPFSTFNPFVVFNCHKMIVASSVMMSS